MYEILPGDEAGGFWIIFFLLLFFNYSFVPRVQYLSLSVEEEYFYIKFPGFLINGNSVNGPLPLYKKYEYIIKYIEHTIRC